MCHPLVSPFLFNRELNVRVTHVNQSVSTPPPPSCNHFTSPSLWSVKVCIYVGSFMVSYAWQKLFITTLIFDFGYLFN